MKNMFIAVVVALVTSSGVAEDLIKIGGEGKVAIVNTVNASTTSIETAAKKIGNLLMITVESQKGSWSLATANKAFESTGANVAVFVVKDSSLPISLIAMESKWGMVNADGLSAKGLEKEILRVATVLLGGASSKYPASTMRPVFSSDDLDNKAGEVITFDSLMSIFTYLPDLGVKQYQMMTREEAIEEGLLKE